MSDLDNLVSTARSDFAAAATPADLENAKARYLGKAGCVTELLKALGTLSVEEKKARGAQINATKQQIEAALESARDALASAALDATARNLGLGLADQLATLDQDLLGCRGHNILGRGTTQNAGGERDDDLDQRERSVPVVGFYL